MTGWTFYRAGQALADGTITAALALIAPAGAALVLVARKVARALRPPGR
jgi:hypothetical protein